jgi:hypothetical protein
MKGSLREQVEVLYHAPLATVRAQYRQLFDEEPRSKHKESLVRRIAWRLQAISEGGLSERARQRAFAIAKDEDLRVLPPRGGSGKELCKRHSAGHFDGRIPSVGTLLKREFRGRIVAVKVLASGFEYEGRNYGSLSAIATEVAGSRWNGLAFFRLTAERRTRKVSDAARKS